MHRLAFALVALLATAVQAQSVPHLDGQIWTDPAAGTLRGDVCLSALPAQATQTFLLNRGLNVRDVRDAETGAPRSLDGFYDATNVGDATRYSVAGAGAYCVRYVGAFPVYSVDAGERASEDWKGQIAFDGATVRAAEQTRFYPVPEDSASGMALEAVSYRIDVDCPTCAALYLNGSAPVAGPRASFASDLARPLFLYAGAFPFSTDGDTRFVGAVVSPADAAVVRAGVAAIARIHEATLGLPSADDPAFLTFASVSRDRQLDNATWAFVTWPTVALDGRVPFSALIDSTDGARRLDPFFVDLLSHEMAHFYFGARYTPRGPLTWFLLESTAEFLSLKAIRVLRGDAAYTEAVQDHYRDALSAGAVTPLDSVTVAARIGENYRYRLGPLLLLALEDYVGAEHVRGALASLITDPPAGDVDYAAFRARLVQAGAVPEALDQFGAECLVRDLRAACLASRFGPATE